MVDCIQFILQSSLELCPENGTVRWVYQDDFGKLEEWYEANSSANLSDIFRIAFSTLDMSTTAAILCKLHMKTLNFSDVHITLKGWL